MATACCRGRLARQQQGRARQPPQLPRLRQLLPQRQRRQQSQWARLCMPRRGGWQHWAMVILRTSRRQMGLWITRSAASSSLPLCAAPQHVA